MFITHGTEECERGIGWTRMFRFLSPLTREKESAVKKVVAHILGPEKEVFPPSFSPAGKLSLSASRGLAFPDLQPKSSRTVADASDRSSCFSSLATMGRHRVLKGSPRRRLHDRSIGTYN